jgi:glycosyltransferase involved in cell wall biosynthesis
MKIIQKLNYWWFIPLKLLYVLRTENANILHVHLSLLHYVKKISKRIKHIKLFYTCHSEPRVILSGKKKYENKAARYLIKNNNLQMIALHDEMRMEINSMFNISNTIVIRNAIDFNKFLNISKSKPEIRSGLNIPKDAFVVGHVGRFNKVKNHTFLVDIFNEVYKTNKNAFLLLVGAGKLKDQIQKKLESYGLNGHYIILSHRGDVPQIMKAMDVFVFPSFIEGFGIVLIEAQVSGLRCIVSDKIAKEVFQTSFIISLDLKEPVTKWAKIVLDSSIRGESSGNIDNYDMNKEIRRLERLYQRHLDV